MSLPIAASSSMRASELLRRRLDNQWIASPRTATPGELVAWMVALQAQDYAGAKWSIGLRLRGLTDDDVERAIAARQIVRSWPFRGTLHFVAADDLRWLLDLGAARTIAAAARRHRELGLEERDVTRSQRAFRSELRG